MKTIKFKILINFCVTGALVIAIIGVAVSLRLDKGISQKLSLLSHDLTTLSNETLESDQCGGDGNGSWEQSG